MRLYKEYADMNKATELVIDKAEYLKLLEDADELLLLINKLLGRHVR